MLPVHCYCCLLWLKLAEAEAEAGAVADAAQCSEAGKERSWEYMQQVHST